MVVVQVAAAHRPAALDDLAPLDRMRRGGRLIIAGAGTSGQLARNEAMECVPTFGLEPGRVIALIAGGFDVATTNEKLRHRAVRIIAESTGHDLETAARADRDTGHDVAAAIFMLRTGVDGPTAVSHLAACNGRLREALTRWPATPS